MTVLVVLALAAGALQTAPVRASGAEPVESGTLFRIPLPEEVRAAMQRSDRAARPPAAAPDGLASPAQETIAVEQFEGEQFPPEGWEVVDRIAARAGVDPQWTWGRQTCEVQPQAGGQAAAWAPGGGEQGDELPCWSPYEEDVDTLLLYAGIDTTNYQGGVSVRFLFKPDLPRSQAFSICWARSPQEDATCRAYNIPPEQMNRWLEPADTVLPDTSGATDLVVFFRYLDENPNGAARGAIVDNVLLEGLVDEPTAPPTPQPTTPPPPTSPPAPTATPRTGVDIFMPLTLKRIAMEDLPPAPTAPPPPDWKVTAQMGTVDDEGQFAPGTAYQSGLMGLCLLVDWEDLALGTEIRWQWFFNDGVVNPDDTDLNPTIAVDRLTGGRYQCIQNRNPDTGVQVPLPDGSFRTDIYVDDVGPGAPVVTSASAVIGPEGTPPPVPPTPAPTREPGTYVCRQVLVNGDFEQGPDVGWAVQSNVLVEGEPLGPQHVIRHNDDFEDADPAFQGDWLAILGGNPDFDMQMVLYQETAVPLVDAARIITAELRYMVAYVTEETRDGADSDVFGVLVINQDDQSSLIPGTRFSEETLDPQRWFSVRVNVTELMTQRAGWSTMRLGFASEINDQNSTVHLVDAARLDVCESTTAGVLSAPGGVRAQRAPVGATMTAHGHAPFAARGLSLAGLRAGGATDLTRAAAELLNR